MPPYEPLLDAEDEGDTSTAHQRHASSTTTAGGTSGVDFQHQQGDSLHPPRFHTICVVSVSVLLTAHVSLH
jgi:hypothetical protein